MTIFTDTGPMVGVHNISDQYFGKAVEMFKKIETEKHILVTTDYVLDEVYTLLIIKGGYEKAMAFDNFLRLSKIKILKIDDDRFKSAQGVFRKYNKDKRWSFTDCTSYVVMKEMRLKKILTFDKNFEEMGFEVI